MATWRRRRRTAAALAPCDPVADRAMIGRFTAGLVGLFCCSTMGWLLVWAAGASVLHGSAPVLVASGSMGPSVRAGDLVVLEPYHSQDLEPGMVVRFDDPEGRGSVLHRVVEVGDDGTVRTKGDANAVVDSSAVEAGRITGVGQVLVPRTGLPVLWWRTGEWLALALFGLVAAAAVGVTRYALLDAHDPWRAEPRPAGPRPPLPVAAREAVGRFRDEIARDGPVLVSRRLVLRRAVELTALGLTGAFLAGSSTAWASFADTTGNGTNTFAATTVEAVADLTGSPGGCDVAPAITVVGTGDTGTAPNGAADRITLDRPSGVQAGDVLVAHLSVHTHAFASEPLPAPSGWTRVRADADGAHVIAGVFWRVAGASEPASYTFRNLSGDPTQQVVGAVIAYRGVDPADPVDDHGGAPSVTGSDTLVAPSLTTTRPGGRLLTFAATYGNGPGPATPPGSMTERYEGTVVNEFGIVEVLGEAADETVASAGATGTRSTSVPGTETSVAQALVLRAYVGEPHVDLSWTPSPSPDVDGYVIERRIGTTLDATTTLSSPTADSYTDGPLVSGTTYTYRVIATAGSWRSSPVSTTYTAVDC